jgi:Glycolipid 2-alpha-mannosyltransferase
MPQAYFDYLDHTGGFFYERWGDAPVHSLAAVMLLNATEVGAQSCSLMTVWTAAQTYLE